MREIRYWDPNVLAAQNNSHKKDQVSKLNAVQDDFHKEMFDLLFSTVGGDPMQGVFDSDIPESIFGDTEFDDSPIGRANELRNQDMKKVWAARMQSALPFSDWDSNSDSNKNSYSMSGLDSAIELTVKMQIARAKKHLMAQHNSSQMSLEEYIGETVLKEDTAKASDEDLAKSHELFIESIKGQLDDAAEKFDSSIDELVSQILDKP